MVAGSFRGALSVWSGLPALEEVSARCTAACCADRRRAARPCNHRQSWPCTQPPTTVHTALTPANQPVSYRAIENLRCSSRLPRILRAAPLDPWRRRPVTGAVRGAAAICSPCPALPLKRKRSVARRRSEGRRNQWSPPHASEACLARSSSTCFSNESAAALAGSPQGLHPSAIRLRPPSSSRFGSGLLIVPTDTTPKRNSAFDFARSSSFLHPPSPPPPRLRCSPRLPSSRASLRFRASPWPPQTPRRPSVGRLPQTGATGVHTYYLIGMLAILTDLLMGLLISAAAPSSSTVNTASDAQSTYETTSPLPLVSYHYDYDSIVSRLLGLPLLLRPACRARAPATR